MKAGLLVTVTLAGFLALAIELSLSRLLRPWFGDFLGVWAAVIGFVLLYLALGNWLGGCWSARASERRVLCTFLVAGLSVYLLPLVSRPVLRLAMVGMREYHLALPAAALAVVLLLVALPVTLLGSLNPLAVRLLTREVAESGGVAGQVWALSTVGSLAGAFVPVFLLLPALGTSRTFALLGLIPAAWTGVVWLRQQRWKWALVALSLLVAGAALTPLWTGRAVKGVDPSGRGQVLYEEESVYNFIQVVAWEDERWLRLNEGEGLHSVWREGLGLSEGIWDYFLLAPAFSPAPRDPADVSALLVIGLAGGTVPTLYNRAFGPVPTVGVELDPAVIRVGYRYFGLGDLPALRAVAGDGRVYLATTDERFDVIAVDAYRPPYIPFHLVTVEFFTLAREHLTPRGVVAVNAARTATDFSLVHAISSTMRQVFPSVYIVDEPTRGAVLGNSLVVGTPQPVREADVWANLAMTDNPYLREMARRARGRLRPAPPPAGVFTDDRAPVEQMVHGIMLRYLVGGDGQGVEEPGGQEGVR